jgi:hypothetical protein
MGDHLKTSRITGETVLEAVKQHGNSFVSASEKLKNNEEIVLEALKKMEVLFVF